MTSTRIFLLFILLLVGLQAQNCPQLCLNCTATGCSSCANSFSLNANISTSCDCPTSTYPDTNVSICVPCPVTCISCLSYQKCSKCIDGFTLNNSYACIPLAITENGWTNKNVSYQLNPTIKTARNLNIIIGSTNYLLANALDSSKNCSKLPYLQWLGGQGVFGYNTKLIKTIYGLSPHQWVQIRFQAVLIDNWNGNSLLVQNLSQQLFPNNIITNTSNYTNSSDLSNRSQIMWTDSFSSRNRFRDFCGDNTIPDNLAIVDISASHQVSALRIRIRMGDSQTPYNINSTLNNAFFGIRQLFIRVGTCGRYCLACKNPSTCNKCLSPYSLVNGSCVCNSTLGFNTGSGCQSNCPPGFYLNSTFSYCRSCEYITDNCQLCNSETCLTCEIGFFNLRVNQSVSCVSSCPIGFSENRLANRTSSSSVDFCSPCSGKCAKCPDQLCILCMSGYIFYQNQCVAACPDGTFPSEGFCITCNSTCSSCSGMQTCMSCKSGFGLSSEGRCTRLCANSTTLVTTSGCRINCSSPCSSCFGVSFDECLSCAGSLLLEGSQCVSNCSIGFFKSNLTCQPCPYGCQTCSSAQVCGTCSPNYFFIQKKCLRRCPLSTFPTIDIGNISNCSPCPNGCLKCSKNLCFNCQEGLILFNSSCLSSIPQGFYYNRQFQHFKACQSNCLICNGLECSRCNSNYYLDKGVCVISCPPNKYPFVSKANDNSTYNLCRWKRPTCQRYDGSNNSCAQCSVFETKLYLQGGKCIYNCPQLSTISPNASCSSCPLNCKRCISNQCIECASSYVISPDLTSCIPNYCPQPYFTDSLQCLPCIDGCNICQIDGRCLQCLTGFNLNIEQGICFSSNCSLLSYSNNVAGICQSCISPCRTCVKSGQICTSCDPTSNFQLLYQSTCVSACPNGYFSHSESRSCRKCNPKCSSCLSLRNCQTCIDGYSLLSFYNPYQAECVAECPIGFWSDLQKCQSCFGDCKSCWGPSEYQCLSCYPNFALDQFKCVWQCAPGKYRSASGYCQWCEPGCNRCTGPTIQNCLSCSISQYVSDNVCFDDKCPGATYLAYPEQRICEQCQFGCSLCSSPHFCRFCFPGYNLYQGWCYKQCPANTSPSIVRFWNLQGSYNGIQGYICSQCLVKYTDKCLQCTSDSCISCKAGYYLYKLSQIIDYNLVEQCLTSCPPGTYLKNDSQPQCMACSLGCINCTSYSSCVKCSSGLNIINGYCSSGCPSGNYLNSSQSCILCPTNCASCINALTCTSCASSFFLFFNSSSGNTYCVSNCSLTYYPDSSGWCQKCLPTCASCSSSSGCLSCLSGFTLSSTGICTNQSTSCPTNCESCSGQNCLRCNSPYLLITLFTSYGTSSSCVLSCPVGYYPNTFTCERCTSGCTACVNIENNCTSCSAGLYLLNQKCITNCPVGYYASITSLYCQPCSQNCLNCQNTNCMICQNGYYLSAGSCYANCPSGTYLSSAGLQCYTCPSQCSSCSADQNCTSCLSGYLLLQGNCVSSCPQTAYIYQNTCVQCVAPCLACISITKCLTCLPGLILNGTECQSQCQPGFFKYSFKVSYTSQIANLDFSSLTDCISCDPSCAVCSESSTNCQSCIQPYILYGSSCLDSCPPTSYLSNGTCRSCSPYCAVCIDFSQCLVCVNTTALFVNQCYSGCPPGFQMSSQVNSTINSYVCQQCSPACLTCRGSSSYDCLSCNAGYFWLNGSSCVSTCPTGFYSNFNSQTCLPCPYGCATCNSSNNCTTCINNFTLTSTRICQENSSSCNASNCLNCLSNSVSKCGQCSAGYNLFQGVCYSTCPTTTYSNNVKCIPCSIGCLTCSSQKCLACNSSLVLYQGICISDCPTGTIKVNNTCTNDFCISRSPSGNCQACISPYLLYNSSNDDNQDNSANCVLTCPSGTYQTGGACIKCPSKCIRCISSSQCIQCKSQYSLYNGKCYEDCPQGTYSVASTCINCTLPYCSKCSLLNGAQICKKCKSGSYLYNYNCVIVCPTGTYSSPTSEYCKMCPQNCLACTSENSCTSCKNGTALYNGKCYSNCPTGTYLISNICKQCQSGCLQCRNGSSCVNCLPNYILFTSSNSSSCLNSCPLGYFAQFSPSTTFSNSNQQKCAQCISPCLTCTSNTSCINCPTGYSLMQNTCLNVCPLGYFSSGYQIVIVGGQTTETSRCVPCSPICLSCSGVSNNCSTCPSGFTLASNTCLSNCSTNGYYYNSATRQCNKCSVTCYSCSGPATSNCISCAAPLQLFSGNCLSTCPFGYYPTPTQICQPCTPTCAACSGSAFNCTICASTLLLQVSNGIGTCIQSCSVSYYSTNGYCQPCSFKCLTCSGPADNQCLSCKSGLFLVGQTCIQKCLLGTTALITNSQYSCVPCSTNCNSCFYQLSIQTTQCSQCATDYYLSNGACTLSCPTGTYPSPITYSCDDCNLAGCVKCLLSATFSLTCTQCQAGYYLYNSVCLSFCPNNTISSGSQCVPKPVCTMYQWNGYCLNECPANTFSTSTSSVINGVSVLSLSCKNCSIYCQQCSSELSCAACVSGAYLMPRNSPNNDSYQCVTLCPSGFYQISGSCNICTSPCATCQLLDSGISCLTCLPGFLQMGSVCVSSCPNGYYSTNGSCNLCSNICASCSGSASNCIVCKNINNYAPSCNTSAINCTTSQYLSSASTCSNCHSTCLTCFGGSNSQCSSCASALILVYGSCIANCPTGTIRSGTNCISCPSNCLNCTLTGSSAICNNCATPYMLVPSTGSCVSDCSYLNSASSSFLLINGSCLPCNISGCSSCILSNGSPSCLACKNGSIIYNNICYSTCPSGSVANQAIRSCVPCSNNCAVCSTSACSICSAGFYLLNGQCVSNCGSGYYITNSTCNQCTITNCLNCTSTSCTNCQQPYALINGQCSSCLAGYYFQGGQCQLCSTSCATCFGSSTNCTICKSGYYFYNTTCLSACPSGYYISSAGICTNCTVSNCKQCTINGCSECQIGFVVVVTSGVISCETTCPSATYLDVTSNTCYNCSTGCALCSSAASCNLCNSSLVLHQGYCLSQCPSGLYSFNRTCQSCPTGCKICASASNCSTCSSGLIIFNGICVLPPSNCSTGYYKNVLGNCDQCFTSCKSCQGQSSSDCLSCFNGYTLTNGVCIQNCNTNSYYNTNLSNCQLCSSLTDNCLSCNSTSCLICNANFTVLNGKCTQACPAGTFLNNNNCLPCSSYCFSCNSGSLCNQCLNSSYIIVNGQCVSECPDQTYLKNGQCAACYQTCLTCTGSSSTNCTSCLSPYFLSFSKCVSSCPNGTYADSSYTCQNCSTNCKLCSSSSSCEECLTSYYLINGICRSSCPSGYYIDTTTNRCIECPYPCLSCTARNQCSSCASPSTLSNSMCINSNCSGGYYDFSLNSCRNCTVNNCGYCTNSSCSYCKNGYYSVYSSSLIVYCQSNCPQSTYKDNATYNCSSCYSNCKVCQNGTWCYTCLQGYLLLSVEKSIVNECVDTCPQGYYVNNSTCKSCQSNCISCTNSNDCITCQPEYFLLKTGNSSKCVQNCPTSYFTPLDLSGKGYCGQCSSNCLSCLDLVTCTQCDSGFRIFNDVCVPSNCVNCLTCNYTSNICMNCENGYYIMGSSCVKTCPDYYFGNNITGRCENCIDNCLVCGDTSSCYICITGYEFVNGTGCQNSGFINFGALGNMSGFTSNITQIMAMVYVTTSTGPIAFGALGSTYGLMQLCQVLYIMQGSTDNNQQMNTFLNSLSATSYTSNSGTSNTNTQTSSISRNRLLTAVDYTSNFLQTNLPIFLMMIAFVSAYVLVLLFEKYQKSCCVSCPNLVKYISYTCQFMKMRFKYIYVDTVMWISYIPFLYFSILQLQNGNFSTGANIFSSLLAIVIIILYPLYPLFILRKLFDRSSEPSQDLKNYKSIAILQPQIQIEKSMCADFSCCPKKEKLTYEQMVEKNKLAMVQMSLSPYIQKVKRPVYNQHMEGYNEFKYFKKQHWVLAYAAIKYFRKFLIVLVVSVCSSPSLTLGLVTALIVSYMVYLIALKPKQKLYLVLEIILQSVLLIFILMMLVYVSIGGASVTAMSVVTHAVGFIIANSSLLIAIILNIMSYYTIFCCIYDLIQHLKNKVVEEEQKEKHLDQLLQEKDKIHYDDDIKDKDKDHIQIKLPRRGDDEQTQENNEDHQQFENFELDQKQFVPGSKVIKKKTFGDDDEQDFTNLKSTTKGRRDKRKAERKKSRHLEEESHTSEEIMAQSKLSAEQLHDISEGLLKQRDNKFRRDVNNKDINVIKGQIRDPTDKFKRHSKKLPAQEQQSMDTLHVPHGKEQILIDIRTQDRLINDPKLVEKEKIKKNNQGDLESINMRQREKKEKGIDEANLYDRQGKPKKQGDYEADLPQGKFVNKNSSKKQQPFGQFDEIFAKDEQENIKNAQLKQRQAKKNRQAKKKENEQIMDIDMIDRVQKPRKQENKLYKGSDEQVNVEEGQARQVKNRFRKEGKRKNPNPSQQPEFNINAYGKEITTKKAQKISNNREFAQDNTDQLTYKERQGKNILKGKESNNNSRPEDNLNQAEAYNRVKKIVEKKQKVQQIIPQQNLLSVGFKQVEKRKSSKQKRSIYDNLDNDLSESIQFGGEIVPPQGRKGASRQQVEFEESQMGKVGVHKIEKNKSGNGRLGISENLEQSYEDTIKKNKQQMFKQTQQNKSRMMDLSEDPFEQVEYQRPESKIERPSSRSKDLGLGVNSRQGSEASDDQSRDVRRRKNSAIQRIRKRGQLNVNENDDKDSQDNVGSDSRRVSRIVRNKSKLKGVLNIDDKSENEDIEEMKL